MQPVALRLADPSPALNTAIALLRWGLALLVLLAVLWLFLRWLTRRWRDDADRLATEVDATVAVLDSDLATIRSESVPYPRAIEPPYHAPAQDLHATLDAVGAALNLVNHGLDTLAAERSPAPSPLLSAAPPWAALRDSHQQRAQLRLLLAQAAGQQLNLDQARALLRDLRRTPLELADQARALLDVLDGADRSVAFLRNRKVHGERLDTAQGALQTQRAELAALPFYLLKAKESQIARLAQPAAIIKAWQVLFHLDPATREQANTLENWLVASTQLDHNLTIMHDTMAAADDYLERADPSIDVSDLRARWRPTRQAAQDLEARSRQPRIEDLDDLVLADDIAAEANALIARLASLEALRQSLVEKLTEDAGRLDELARQLRQLAEAGRYPLDRVPFQVELDRLRRQLATIGGLAPSRPRAMAQLESSLASAQVIDQQACTLTTRLAEAREDRRRLIDLLEPSTDRRVIPEVDWLAWAQDLFERTRLYGDANWTASARAGDSSDLRVTAILEDAATLRERARLWVPEHKDDLLDATTLARRVHEVQSLRADTEAFQNRLDAITRRLQHVQHTEEKTRADLEATYAALDRLEIVASGVLAAPLSEEENHWSRVRRHLTQGYDLDVALAAPATGAVWEKAMQVNAWIAACQATLNDWHRVLQRELDASSGAVASALNDLAAIAPLGDEPAVRDARNALQTWDIARSRRADLRERRTGPTPDSTTVASLSDRVSDQLRALAKFDQALAALQATAVAPLGDPVQRWREARQSAEIAFRRLQSLELQSARQWPPVSCDTPAVKAELDQAEGMHGRLKQEGTTVERAIAVIEDLADRYTRVVGLTGEREAAYRALRPHLDIDLERLETWSAALTTYQKEHEADPAVVAAIRARLDEMQSASTHLQIEWERSDTLIPGEDARRALDNLWRQAHRDIPVGAGSNVIPVEWVER